MITKKVLHNKLIKVLKSELKRIETIETNDWLNSEISTGDEDTIRIIRDLLFEDWLTRINEENKQLRIRREKRLMYEKRHKDKAKTEVV